MLNGQGLGRFKDLILILYVAPGLGPRRTASLGVASCRTVSHRVAPRRTASRRVAPRRTASKCGFCIGVIAVVPLEF